MKQHQELDPPAGDPLAARCLRDFEQRLVFLQKYLDPWPPAGKDDRP